MARPRSEEKRLALLNAAANIVATHGLGAPTALIAKTAGVAEGTLFRYFPTKEDLLNELYLYIMELASASFSGRYVSTAPPQERIRFLWNSYIDWQLINVAFSKTRNQLAISTVLTDATRAKGDSFFPDMGLLSEFIDNDIFKGHSLAFADAFFVALADATTEFAAREPEKAEAYKASGFLAMWKLYGKD